jgi:hypothetical protein
MEKYCLDPLPCFHLYVLFSVSNLLIGFTLLCLH